jgi:hypothetical protein
MSTRAEVLAGVICEARIRGRAEAPAGQCPDWLEVWYPLLLPASLLLNSLVCYLAF